MQARMHGGGLLRPAASVHPIKPCVRAHTRRRPVSLCRAQGGNTPEQPSSSQPSEAPSPSQQQPEQQQGPQQQQQQQQHPPPVVEASNVLEADAAVDMTQDSDILPLLPDSLIRRAIEGYTALCVANTVVGLGAALSAACAPGLLLPSSISASPLATTLLGCLGVALARVGSILWFLRHSASLGEAATWRHQRLNGSVAAFAAIALVSQLYALPASAPVLSGLMLVLSAGTLAFCAKHAMDCWAHQPWLQWLVDGSDFEDSIDTGIQFLKRDISSVAGWACLGLLAVCAFGLTGLGQAAGWSLGGVPYTTLDGLYGPGTSPAAVQALNGLRRLCVAGLLPTAMIAHSLLELATHVRVFKAEDLVASELIGSMNQDTRLGRVVSPPPERFTVLFWLGLFAAGAVQAAFLLHAPAVGVDVNRDLLLMGPLHWSVWLSALFSFACIFVVDWVNVQLAVGSALHTVFSLVSGFISTCIMKHEWQARHKL